MTRARSKAIDAYQAPETVRKATCRKVATGMSWPHCSPDAGFGGDPLAVAEPENTNSAQKLRKHWLTVQNTHS